LVFGVKNFEKKVTKVEKVGEIWVFVEKSGCLLCEGKIKKPEVFLYATKATKSLPGSLKV
jgi:hypothetical protein